MFLDPSFSKLYSSCCKWGSTPVVTSEDVSDVMKEMKMQIEKHKWIIPTCTLLAIANNLCNLVESCYSVKHRDQFQTSYLLQDWTFTANLLLGSTGQEINYQLELNILRNPSNYNCSGIGHATFAKVRFLILTKFISEKEKNPGRPGGKIEVCTWYASTGNAGTNGCTRPWLCAVSITVPQKK